MTKTEWITTNPERAANRAAAMLDTYEWAKTQPKVGAAVLFIRQFEQGYVTPNVLATVTRIRDRQIADAILAATERTPMGEPVRIACENHINVVETVQAAMFVEEETVVEAPAPAPAPVKAVSKANPWPGTYTVQHDQGHTTFKILIQPSDAEFAPGATVISYLSGRDNESDYTQFGFLREGRVIPFKKFRSSEALLEHARQLCLDPETALVAKRCARCGHKLTTPESVLRGWGPECDKKGLR